MNILVTGAKGFVGCNLVENLKNIRDGKNRTRPNIDIDNIYEYDIDSTPEQLDAYCTDCDFVFNLAGVNRPKDPKEFREGNFGFASTLLETLKKHNNTCPIMLSSSIQATLQGRFGTSEYGLSKKAGEDLFFDYAKETGAKVLVYRFPNLVGKWVRPNYNSAVGTFCHNIARGLPITINDPEHMMHLAYIDDVVEEFTEDMEILLEGGTVYGSGERNTALRCPVYDTRLGNIAETIESFPLMRESLEIPKLIDPLISKLYSTYLSFLPEDGFAYSLNMKTDNRGSFTEFIRTPDRGQVSVNVSHPGIVKGQHWHDSKNEKFLVVQGRGLIRFRKIGEDRVIDYHVSGEELTVVDIPTGYVHCIINEGDTDMVTIMWANESYDPERPDTYREEV